MNRYILLTLIAAVSIPVAGCVTVKKVVRERADQDVSGNQGYLKGTAAPSAGERPTEREYIDIRVEIPTWNEISSKPEEKGRGVKPAQRKEVRGDAGSKGNKGYIGDKSGVEESLPSRPEKQPRAVTVYEYDDVEMEAVSDDEIVVFEEEAIKPVYREYTVKEDDTLSHIAKAFYDRASKWTIIYEANADKLKDPGSLKAGMVLIIPDLEETESKYAK